MYTATVTSIVSFGVFVCLETGEDGMVHISEVSENYVTNINDILSVNDVVQVKFLRKNEKSQLELSIRQVQSEEPRMVRRPVVANEAFEEKMNQFLKQSGSVLVDVRRNLKVKQGLVRKKRTSRKKG